VTVQVACSAPARIRRTPRATGRLPRRSTGVAGGARSDYMSGDDADPR